MKVSNVQYAKQPFKDFVFSTVCVGKAADVCCCFCLVVNLTLERLAPVFTLYRCVVDFSNTSTSTCLMSCGSVLGRFVRMPSSPSTAKEKTLRFPANLWPPSGTKLCLLQQSRIIVTCCTYLYRLCSILNDCNFINFMKMTV